MTETKEEPAEEEVTLHVSVWVEIINQFTDVIVNIVTLHVSVWVEI